MTSSASWPNASFTEARLGMEAMFDSGSTLTTVMCWVPGLDRPAGFGANQ